MKRSILILIIVIIGTPHCVYAKSDRWGFSLGYAYLSGFDKLKDTYQTRSRKSGHGDDIYNISSGISFQVYRRFENGFRAGAGAGPLLVLFGDANHYQLPARLTCGYSFFRKAGCSPYVRAGISYHFASGDYLDCVKPGFFGGMGINFFNQKPLRLGMEAGYDTSRLILKKKETGKRDKAEIGELTLSIFADF